jgi:hypothetical protein
MTVDCSGHEHVDRVLQGESGPLLTRDRDFRAFADAAGLDLVLGSAT